MSVDTDAPALFTIVFVAVSNLILSRGAMELQEIKGEGQGENGHAATQIGQEIRNPKSEGRKKSEIRRPRSENVSRKEAQKAQTTPKLAFVRVHE